MDKKKDECLKIINYDFKRHNSYKAALEEILSRDRYSQIMRGIINDSKALKEVREIIEAYKYLKQCKEESDLNVEDEIELFEVIFYDYEGNTFLLKKNNETNCYEKIHEFVCKDFFIGENYFIDNGLYNFNGELIDTKIRYKDKENVKKITDRIIKVKDKYVCLSKDEKGDFLSIKQSEQINILLDNDFDNLYYGNENNSKKYHGYDRNRPIKSLSEESKNKLFYLIYSKETPQYCSKKIYSVSDKYIGVVDNGEKTYYDINGNKLLSTLDGDYCYIGRIPYVEDERNIIVIGKYDEYFRILYGYYDLDNKEELLEPQYLQADDWIGYFGLVMDGKYMVDYRGKKINSENLIGKYITSYAPIIKLIKLNDDKYIAKYFINNYYNVYAYLLFSISENKIDILSENFFDYKYSNIDNTYYVQTNYPQYYYENGRILNNSRENWKKMLLSGEFISIISRDYSKNSNINDIKPLSYLEKNLNSSFLLPQGSDFENNALVKSKRLPKELTVNNINQNALTFVEDSKLSYGTRNDAPNDNLDHDIIEICQIGNNGSIIVRDFYHHLYAINKNGKLLFPSTTLPQKIDENGNIILLLEKERKALIDESSNIIIGPSNEIISGDNAYIVKLGGKAQLYNSKGEPISYLADNQNWISKYYITENGIVKKSSEKLIVTNLECDYLIDDNGDIIIKESEKLKEIDNIKNLLKS